MSDPTADPTRAPADPSAGDDGGDGVAQRIADLVGAIDGVRDRRLLAEMLTAAVDMARDGTDRLDLKIAANTLAEMHEAARVFGPHRGVRKAAVFGSARTPRGDPAWDASRELGAALAAAGWMVITGGGPGIMTATVEGAGPRNSFGVSIRLPFEPPAGPGLFDPDMTIDFRYFFNRKLTFMKESSAYVLFPGGFGTLDETFELLTLLQTGREVPTPVVLFEPQGDAYWRTFRHFVDVELLDPGLINPADVELFTITSDVAEAVDAVAGFYRTYHSLRHVGDRLVIRLNHDVPEDTLARLNEEFADLVVPDRQGRRRIERCGPTNAEQRDGDHTDLPRLCFRYTNDHHSRLHALVRSLSR